MFAYYVGAIYPEGAFNPAFDITVALMAFLGGLGIVVGPLVGALFLIPFQQWLDLQFGGKGVNLMIYGLLFLAVILVLPRGIVPSLQSWWTSWKASRAKVAGISTKPEQPIKLVERGGEG